MSWWHLIILILLCNTPLCYISSYFASAISHAVSWSSIAPLIVAPWWEYVHDIFWAPLDTTVDLPHVNIYDTFVNQTFNTLRPRQNGRHSADDAFKRIFTNENVRISINFSLKFVPKGMINNVLALVQKMAWHQPGAKPLSEPMMVNSLTHICVTRPQWVNSLRLDHA